MRGFLAEPQVAGLSQNAYSTDGETETMLTCRYLQSQGCLQNFSQCCTHWTLHPCRKAGTLPWPPGLGGGDLGSCLDMMGFGGMGRVLPKTILSRWPQFQCHPCSEVRSATAPSEACPTPDWHHPWQPWFIQETERGLGRWQDEISSSWD